MSVEIGGPFCGASGCTSDDDVEVVQTDAYGKRALCAAHRDALGDAAQPYEFPRRQAPLKHFNDGTEGTR